MINGDAEDVFAAAMSGGDMPETGTLENLGQEDIPAEVSPAVAEPDKAPDPAREDGAVPSWRLREVQEEKRQFQREAEELRKFKETVEAERKAKEGPKNFYEADDPDAYLGDKVRAEIDPVQKAIQEARDEARKTREFYSQREAIRDHGIEKVSAAHKALDEAINSGALSRDAVLADLAASMDPYGDIIAWHKKHTLLTEIGNDPEAYRQRQSDELLKDPEFLAKAVEAARAQAFPVNVGASRSNPAPNNVTSLPSLNRTPAAARDEDEPEDPVEVFNSALGSRRRS
jgi:hypothetical protein